MRISEHDYPPGFSQPPHAHDTSSCSILLAGTLCERVGSREEIARPLSVVLKPLDTEHSDRFGPLGARLIRITLCGETSTEAPGWAPGLRRWHWAHCGPASRSFLALVSALRRVPIPDLMAEPRAEMLAWDIVALVAAHKARRSGGDPPAWLAGCREALMDAQGALRLSALASSAGVHPVYLARQFRRFFGCSISAYVHRLNVQRAADLIAGGTLPLSRVALAAGFTDQSHMCRIFRRETGLTPGAYQRIGAEVQRVQDAGSLAA